MPRCWGAQIKIEMPKLDDKTEGGIYVPPELLEKYESSLMQGKIVEIGPCAFCGLIKGKEGPEECGINLGMDVYIPRYAGREYKMRNGTIYRVINDNEISAIVEEGDELIDVVFGAHAVSQYQKTIDKFKTCLNENSEFKKVK